MNLLTILIIFAMIMTAVVLFTGIGSMVHGGDFDEKHSEQFMFARVIMQAITLVLLGIAIYVANA